MKALRLRLDSTPQEVSMAGAAIRAILEDQGASPSLAGEVELASVEVLNNVVEHAYEGLAGNPIEVLVQVGPDDVVVEIRDQGEACDPALLAVAEVPTFDASDPDSIPEGGFGLGIIRMLTDEARYLPRDPLGVDTWNLFRFARSLTPRMDPPVETP